MKKSFHFPDYMSGSKEANAFAELYLGDGPNPRVMLARLEQQALFFLLVETLETPELEFTELLLCPPDDPDDTTWINLKDANGDELDLVDESEEVGAAAILLLRELPYLCAGHPFVDALSEQPLTHDNKWNLAARLFGEEVSSAMQADHLKRSVPKARAHPRQRL